MSKGFLESYVHLFIIEDVLWLETKGYRDVELHSSFMESENQKSFFREGL